MKGGSIASDAVVSLVDQKTFDSLNTMFDNKVGGSRSCTKCSSSQKCTHMGGSLLRMLGTSTLEAFQTSSHSKHGGARAVPKRKPVAKKPVKKGKTGHKGGSAESMVANVAKSVSNAARSLNNALTQSSAAPRTNSANVKANAPQVASNAKQGGNMTMPQLLASNSGNFNVRNRMSGGAANPSVVINPQLDLQSMTFQPRVVTEPTGTDLLSQETIAAPSLIQKSVNYGNVTSGVKNAFSFGQSPTEPLRPIQGSVTTGLSGGKRASNKVKVTKAKAPVKAKKPAASKKKTTKRNK